MLRRLTCSLLCFVGSSHAFALNCADAQKSALGLSPADKQELTVEDQAYTDQNAFVQSKPQLDGRHITTGTFIAKDGPYEQMWCKMKSQEAVLEASGFQEAGGQKDCATLNREQLEQALAAQPNASSLDRLGIQLIKDRDFSTGAEWAPSQVVFASRGHVISVQGMRLQSPSWIPIIGGMNYCKLLSPAGAQQLVKAYQDKTTASLTSDSYQPISWSGGFGAQQNALVLVRGDLTQTLAAATKGVYIISPGAEIPAQAMSGLALRLSEVGYLPVIVQYPNNVAILDIFTGRGNSAINLARLIKSNPAGISGLPATAFAGKPVNVFGHSLGGATLADEVYRNGAASVFDHIVLYGTGSFVKFGGTDVPTSSPISFLFGENDGLSANDIPNILRSFDVPYDQAVFTPVTSTTYPNLNYHRLKGLNHFCIVSDQSVGNGMLKLRDGAGLAPDACLDELAKDLAL